MRTKTRGSLRYRESSGLALSARSTGLGLVAVLSVGLAGVCTGQRTCVRVSVDSEGLGASAWSYGPSISADGRYTAFESSAVGLVSGDTNGAIDAFVHDRLLGRTVRASVSSSGVEAQSEARFPVISGDGRFVAFGSSAGNLVAGDTNGASDIFVRDLSTNETTRVSVGPGGLEANGSSLSEPGSLALSRDGRFVVFSSGASNLVPGDTNGHYDVFVHDRGAHVTTRVSVRSDGTEADDGSPYPTAISGDGRIVGFGSSATNLVVGDTNGVPDVFTHDRLTGVTTRVSVSSTGAQGEWGTTNPSLTFDGRYVAFHSPASTLVPLDTNGRYDVFVHDRSTAQTVRVSNDLGGPAEDSRWPTLSADGARIAFASELPSQPSQYSQVYVKDLQTGVYTIASREPFGFMFHSGNGDSWLPVLAADAAIVAFHSDATNLIRDDVNGVMDVFVTDLFAWSPTIATYCTASATTHGCAPSISGFGVPRNNASSGFTITVSDVEGDKAGLIFYGLQGPRAVPFGGGSSVMCIASPLQRTPVQSSGGTAGTCSGTLSLDWNAFHHTHPEALGYQTFAGRTVWAQGWFRDPLAPGGSNLSNALWFTVCE